MGGQSFRTNKILNVVDQLPSVESITEQYTKPIPNLTDWSASPTLRTATIPITFDSISPVEVKAALKKTDKSVPEEDGIHYTSLIQLDPDGIILSEHCNTIINTMIIPKCWKQFKTILIPKPGKSGQYHDVVNWRPIALLSTTYKLFTDIITKKLEPWASANNHIHSMQKSISRTEGCARHAFCLSGIIEDHKMNEKKIALAWLDLAEAFPSIPHEFL